MAHVERNKVVIKKENVDSGGNGGECGGGAVGSRKRSQEKGKQISVVDL